MPPNHRGRGRIGGLVGAAGLEPPTSALSGQRSVYIGSGDSYEAPAGPLSDSLLAIDAGHDLGGGVSVVNGQVFLGHGFWFLIEPANPFGGFVAYGLP